MELQKIIEDLNEIKYQCEAPTSVSYEYDFTPTERERMNIILQVTNKLISNLKQKDWEDNYTNLNKK